MIETYEHEKAKLYDDLAKALHIRLTGTDRVIAEIAFLRGVLVATRECREELEAIK